MSWRRVFATVLVLLRPPGRSRPGPGVGRLRSGDARLDRAGGVHVFDVSACAAAARFSMGHGGNTRLASSRKAFTHDQFAVESEPRKLGLAGSKRVTARTTIQPCDTSRTTGSQGNETNQYEVMETRSEERRVGKGGGTKCKS